MPTLTLESLAADVVELQRQMQAIHDALRADAEAKAQLARLTRTRTTAPAGKRKTMSALRARKKRVH
jgi:hypothetical protein